MSLESTNDDDDDEGQPHATTRDVEEDEGREMAGLVVLPPPGLQVSAHLLSFVRSSVLP
jgi:hypothetical protein